jgi:hypothetical protein
VRGSIVDVTFTSEELRVTRAAVLQYVVEESKAVKHLERIQCHNMADAINKDVKLAEQVLKLL